MLLIITPLSGWRRKIMVFEFQNASQAEIFEAFQAVNEMYDNEDQRDKVNIALVPISLGQLPDWIENNVDPTWWETLRHRVKYTITTMRRPDGMVG